LQAIEAPAECLADRAAPQPGPAVINIAQKFNRMEGLRQGGPGRSGQGGCRQDAHKKNALVQFSSEIVGEAHN
jgi:hypothetical protein